MKGAFRKRCRRAYAVAVFLSFLLHFSFVGTSFYVGNSWPQAVWPVSEVAPSAMQLTPPPATESSGVPQNASSPEAYRAEMLRRMAAAKNMSQEEALHRLAQLAEQGVNISDTSLDEIALFLGAEKGTYQKRHAPSAGPLKNATATIHDVEDLTGEDGVTTYRVTMIDREGHTKSFLAKGEQAAAITPFARIVGSSPVIRRVYQRVFVPLLPGLVGTTSTPPGATGHGQVPPASGVEK